MFFTTKIKTSRYARTFYLYNAFGRTGEQFIKIYFFLIVARKRSRSLHMLRLCFSLTFANEKVRAVGVWLLAGH